MMLDDVKGQEEERPAILVLGVGNILLRDEGVGVRVVEAMQHMTMPDNVELLDGGTAAMALLGSLCNRERVIVIDAVRGDKSPGTLYRFAPSDISVRKEIVTSLHQIGLLETLSMVEWLGGAPRSVTIYGIEPKELGVGLELSPEVAATIPRVIGLVFDELGIAGPSRC